MTIAERVARAIAIGTAHNPDTLVLDEGPMWKQFVPAARAAIAVVIEESAKIAEYYDDNDHHYGRLIATNIRGLGKP